MEFLRQNIRWVVCALSLFHITASLAADSYGIGHMTRKDIQSRIPAAVCKPYTDTGNARHIDADTECDVSRGEAKGTFYFYNDTLHAVVIEADRQNADKVLDSALSDMGRPRPTKIQGETKNWIDGSIKLYFAPLATAGHWAVILTDDEPYAHWVERTSGLSSESMGAVASSAPAQVQPQHVANAARIASTSLVSVETQSDTSLYGIALFKPLSGFEECPTYGGTSHLAARQSDPSSTFGAQLGQALAAAAVGTERYLPFDSVSSPCFAHTDTRLIGSEPTGTETVVINWPLSRMPDMYVKLTVSLIEGVVHGLYLTTPGIDTQEHDYSLLTAKFGKPSAKRTISMQNRLGAMFNVIDASWQRPAGVIVTYKGASLSLDSGIVTVSSKQEAARASAEVEKHNEGRPKL